MLIQDDARSSQFQWEGDKKEKIRRVTDVHNVEWPQPAGESP